MEKQEPMQTEQTTDIFRRHVFRGNALMLSLIRHYHSQRRSHSPSIQIRSSLRQDLCIASAAYARSMQGGRHFNRNYRFRKAFRGLLKWIPRAIVTLPLIFNPLERQSQANNPFRTAPIRRFYSGRQSINSSITSCRQDITSADHVEI